MHVKRINRPVFKLDDAHPAKVFLNAFIDCRSNCVGRELGEPPIDQSWQSLTDGKAWSFSAFAYSVLSFDIELDGYLKSSPRLTESEVVDIQQIPLFRALMHECAAAAERDGNQDIVELTDEVLAMFSLWENYLEFRKEMISKGSPDA